MSMRRKAACALAAILALGVPSWYLCAKDLPIPMGSWIDFDWSYPNSYQSGQDVETLLEPGQVVLAGDPHTMVRSVDPSEAPGAPPKSFWGMASHNGKLYAGYGMPPIGETHNQPPEYLQFQIWEYDPASGVPMRSVYQGGSEGILILKKRGDRLLTPSIDSMRPYGDADFHWSSDGRTWQHPAGIPGIWLYDIERYRDRIYVSGRGYYPGENPQQPACVWSSDLAGSSWTRVQRETLNADHYAMTVFNDRLFLQPRSRNLLRDKILMFDGTTWTETSAPGIPDADGIMMGRFAEFRGKLYFHIEGLLYRFDPAALRWDRLYSPGSGLIGYPKGFAAEGGYLYMGGGWAENGGYPIFWRTDDPDHATNVGQWEEVDRSFGHAPVGWAEKIRDFAVFRGRLHLCTANPSVESLGGAIYVASASASGHLVSNIHDVQGSVREGAVYLRGLREGTPTDFGLQFRAGATQPELEGRAFTGPDGTGSSLYREGAPLAGHHLGGRFYQYKMVLTSTDPRFTPSVDSAGLIVTLDPGPGGTMEEMN